MMSQAKGTGVVGYNVQVAVDTKHHLIVTHEVTNVGVWSTLHELLLAKLRQAGELDFPRAAVDASSVRAVGAGENWPESLRSLAIRFEALHRRRHQWRHHQCHPNWRESQRRYTVAAARRRDSAHSQCTWPTASQAQSHLHRSRLRLGAVSRAASCARNRTGDRQAPYRTWQRAWQIPLDGRAYSRYAISRSAGKSGMDQAVCASPERFLSCNHWSHWPHPTLSTQNGAAFTISTSKGQWCQVLDLPMPGRAAGAVALAGRVRASMPSVGYGTDRAL